jgi:hypothetical protein
VTHDLDTLFTICDRVAVLVNKKIRVGTVKQLLRDDYPWRARAGARRRTLAGSNDCFWADGRPEIATSLVDDLASYLNSAAALIVIGKFGRCRASGDRGAAAPVGQNGSQTTIPSEAAQSSGRDAGSCAQSMCAIPPGPSSTVG